MNDIKGILQSRTLWTLLAGFLASLAQKYGVDFGMDDQAAFVDQALSAVELVSYGLAAYFRFHATKQLVPAATVAK